MKMHEFIKENYDFLKSLVKIGLVSPVILNKYNIYKMFQDCKHINSKMNKYNWIADKINMSTIYVIKSIDEMNKNI